MTPEKKVQNAIIKYLHSLEKAGLPIFFERRQAGGFSYKNGIADIYVVYDGIHIELEIKEEDGERSVMQEKWESICNSKNILYICAYSVEDVKISMKKWFNINM